MKFIDAHSCKKIHGLTCNYFLFTLARASKTQNSIIRNNEDVEHSQFLNCVVHTYFEYPLLCYQTCLEVKRITFILSNTLSETVTANLSWHQASDNAETIHKKINMFTLAINQ